MQIAERSQWAVIPVTIRKVRPDTVPELWQGVATGPWVYAVYDGETLLGVYATMREAKRKHSVWRQVSKEEQHIMNKRRYQTIKQQGGRGLPKSHGG